MTSAFAKTLPAPRVILITGATSGHGRYLAEQLAANPSGHIVLLHGRDLDMTARVAAELGARPYVADFSDLAQVKRMADQVAAENPRIDTIVNNAGIGYGAGREVSAQGLELRFAVMYLAPMILTRRLLHRISARILNIASLGQAAIDFEDPMMERHYDGVLAYRRAKLALVMETLDLAAERPDLRVNAIHPASAMDTPMVRRGGGTPLHTVADGGGATLRVLQTPWTGQFFDQDRPARAHADAYDPALRGRLRRATDAILSRSGAGL